MKGTGRILLTRRLQDGAMKELREMFLLETYDGDSSIPRDSLVSMIADKEGLICMPYDVIDRGVIDAAPNLRAISTYSVGYDHIDVQYARSRGILIGHTPDVLTAATADLAFALMLDVMRRVSEGDRMVRSGRWLGALGPRDFLGMDLDGKTVGILGPGRIGIAFAGRARAFGMRVKYHGRRRLPEGVEGQAGLEYVSLERLFAESDVVSLHIPYTEETHGMVDRNLLCRMGRRAFIVNTSRGKVINQRDLVETLWRGDIAGAALDVFYDEPLEADSPLIGMDNVVLVPHVGSSTVETRSRMAEIAILNLRLAMAGKDPKYPVFAS